MTAQEPSQRDWGWCLTARVVAPPPRADGTPRRAGTRLYSAGQRVWCDPPLWGDGYERVHVVGRHRRSHRYVAAIVPRTSLGRWDVERVYSPTVARLLRGAWREGLARRWAESLRGERVELALVWRRAGPLRVEAGGAAVECFPDVTRGLALTATARDHGRVEVDAASLFGAEAALDLPADLPCPDGLVWLSWAGDAPWSDVARYDGAGLRPCDDLETALASLTALRPTGLREPPSSVRYVRWSMASRAGVVVDLGHPTTATLSWGDDTLRIAHWP